MAKVTKAASQQELDKVSQYKMNGLAAKHLHQQRLGKLRQWSTFVDCLGFIVPILYFPIRYLLKGTGYQDQAEHTWEVLAAVLTALALIKVFYKWTESAEAHSRLRSENMKAVTMADKLLRTGASPTHEDLDHFYTLMDKLEEEDRDSILKFSDAEAQAAYRQGLKEFEPGGIPCPVCHSSPWKFKKGSCQQCGNTVATEASV